MICIYIIDNNNKKELKVTTHWAVANPRIKIVSDFCVVFRLIDEHANWCFGQSLPRFPGIDPCFRKSFPNFGYTLSDI